MYFKLTRKTMVTIEVFLKDIHFKLTNIYIKISSPKKIRVYDFYYLFLLSQILKMNNLDQKYCLKLVQLFAIN